MQLCELYVSLILKTKILKYYLKNQAFRNLYIFMFNIKKKSKLENNFKLAGLNIDFIFGYGAIINIFLFLCLYNAF